MDILQTRVQTSSAEFQSNRARMGTLVAELDERLAAAQVGGGPKARQRHREQGKLPVRERIERLIDAQSAFFELSPPRRVRDVRQRRASSRPSHRHRPRGRARGHGDCERCDRERRHLLPDHPQEALARAIGGARQSAPVCVSGRLGRRVLADAGRGLSGSGPFWPDLLQSGAHVGGTTSTDRRRDGLVHGRRRVCARDGGRDRDRQGYRHDLPGRPTARQSRDGRRRHRGGTGRRRCAYPVLRRRRLLRRR